jgi:hypothetical protein
MINKFKLPLSESSGSKSLNGAYKVSFDINISSDDKILIDDLTQAIASGFEDSIILAKISHLDFEKVNKDGSVKQVKPVKVGDVVRLINDIEIVATILYDEGYYTIGKETLTTQNLGEMEVVLTKDSTAIVNQIIKEGVELIDFDSSVTVPLEDPETSEICDSQVNIDLVTLDTTDVEAVED